MRELSGSELEDEGRRKRRREDGKRRDTCEKPRVRGHGNATEGEIPVPSAVAQASTGGTSRTGRADRSLTMHQPLWHLEDHSSSVVSDAG